MPKKKPHPESQKQQSNSYFLMQQKQIRNNFKSQTFINDIQNKSPTKTQKPNIQLNTYTKQKDISIISQIDESSQDEEEYQIRQKQKELIKQNKNKLIHKKMAVGSGFNLDMTDFFKFKKKRKFIASLKNQNSILSSISGGHLAWIILIYTVCNAAIMPAWIMSIKANKILRISWRFILQAIVMIPFVLYERRTGNEQTKKKYQLSYIFDLQGLRKVYISSIGTSLWFTIILTCFQWTYISHSIVLGSLSNFFLSINRVLNHTTHQLQPGGQIFVLAGVLFVIADSYKLDVEESSHSVWNVINTYYLTRQPFQRVIADITALSAALIISRFSQMSADLKTYYPPFLSMFLVNISVSFHVALSAFFINGATFDRDTDFGVWGLFTGIHFGGFFYMAVILSFGMYISYTMISKLFSDPIIPALAMTLEPFFATFFLNLVSVQTMPGSFSIYGYIFLICGLFLILIGQFLIQRQKQIQQRETQIQNQLKQKLMIGGADNQLPEAQSQLKMQESTFNTHKEHQLSDNLHHLHLHRVRSCL